MNNNPNNSIKSIKIDKILVEKLDIIIYRKDNEIKYLSESLNKLLSSNKEKDKIIKDLNNKLSDNSKIIESLENNINVKKEEIQKLKNELENKINPSNNSDKSGKIMCVNFISNDNKIAFAIPCYDTNTFAEVEEKLYQEYPEYRETNNNFIVQDKQILRFKTINENNIKSGKPVMLVKPS